MIPDRDPRRQDFASDRLFLPLALLCGVTSALAATMPTAAAGLTLFVVLLVAAAAFPAQTGWAFLAGMMILSDPLAMRRYDVGFGVFGADALLLILPILLFHTVIRGDLSTRGAIPVSVAVLGAAGPIFAAWAVTATGHDLRDIVGDLRRYFFYPLAFFLGLYLQHHTPNALRRATKLGGVAALAISAMAILRLASGQGYRPEQFQEEFRAFSFFDSTVLFLPFGFLIGCVLLQRSRRLLHGLLLVALLVLQAWSGYRLAWALLLAVPLVAFALMAFRTRRLAYLLAALPLLAVAIAITVLMIWLQPELVALWRERLRESAIALQNLQLTWRFLSWATAFNRFLEHPIGGVGLGYVHEFWILNSAGAPVLTAHTTHNAFATYLAQTGLIGLVLFGAVHLTYIRLLMRALSSVPLHELAYYIGLVSFYFAALAVSNFQPFLSSPGGAALLYGLMGLSHGTLMRWSRSSATPTADSPQPG